MVINTPHLELRRIEINQEDLDPVQFLPIFNTNPEWLDASSEFTDRRSVDVSYVEMMLWQESLRENSRLFQVRLRDTQVTIGVVAMAAPSERGQFAALGLILLAKEYQRRGFGCEALYALENLLKSEGWCEIQAAVMHAIPCQRDFFEECGYSLLREDRDQDKRLCWVMQKQLRTS